MNEAEKERLIKKDLVSIENRVRHAFNQGYEMGVKENKKQSDDAISRQAVLNAIMANCIWENEYNLTSSRIKKAVESLPPVTPQQTIGAVDI